MVSQTPLSSEIPTVVPGVNRGFIPEETFVAAGPGNLAGTVYYRPFWRPVVAGALFVITAFVLSWYLMLGFHVGIDDNGIIALGGGAAIWLWVTAIIAYNVGGMIASAMTSSQANPNTRISGSLKGCVIWALSVPLALVIYGIVARMGVPIFTSLSLPNVSGVVEPNNMATLGLHTGFYWSMFIGLGLGLVFSIMGAISGTTCRSSHA